MDDTHEAIVAAATDLIAEVGLPPEFRAGLNEGDDWTFVIKLHALVEAGVTHALTVHADREGAKELFANLELNNPRTGKVAFASVFLRLESEDRRFLRALSELRNQLVHDVRNVSFTFEKHFAGLNLDQKRNFAKAFAYVDLEGAEESAVLDTMIARRQGNWRPTVLKSAMFFLAILQLQVDTTRAAKEAAGYRDEIARMRSEIANALGPNTLFERTRER